MRIRRTLCIAFAAALYAQTWPQPPCESQTSPPFPALEASPTVKVWNTSDADRAWKPSACTGWTQSDSATIVATAARFRVPGGMDALRRRIGAISETTGLLYWSSTQKRWQKLILDAHASTGPDGETRRRDFSPEEFAEGRTLYFEQEDNLFGAVNYRMRIRTATTARLVIDIENTSAIRYLSIPVFQAGDVQSITYLEKEGSDIWRYYAIARTSGKATSLIAGHEASAINRAVALYRRLAGIPPDQEPPAAR